MTTSETSIRLDKTDHSTARLLAGLLPKILIGLALTAFIGYLIVYAIYAVELFRFPFDYDQGEGFELMDTLLFSRGDVLGTANLKFDRWLNRPEPAADSAQSLSEVERRHIVSVLRLHQGHVELAANVLQVPRSSLYAKLKKYGINASEY